MTDNEKALSKNFKRSEFACRCGCGLDTVDAELLHVLQDLRDHFRCRVNIHCGIRCPAHNAKVGGVPTSQHLTGKAADIDITGIDHRTIYDYLDAMYPQQYGIAVYSWGVHLDVRKTKGRW